MGAVLLIHIQCLAVSTHIFYNTMKAVFSFYSKPFFENGNKKNGEFYDLRMFYNSFVLSTMLAYKHFKKIELYTDSYGKMMLERIGLPFNKIHIILDDLTEKEKYTWAISKIKTHLYQTEPYVLIDYDVYLWDLLPQHMLEADIFCQNIEIHKTYYDIAYRSYIRDCNYGHKIIDEYLQKNGLKVYAPNVGIIGGNNIQILKEYALIVLDIINNAQDPKKPYIMIPMFLEQWFLGMFCLYNKIKIKSFGVGYHGWGTNFNFNYTHLQGGCKKEFYLAEKLEKRVSNNFPEFQNNINKALRDFYDTGAGGYLLWDKYYENYL
jgi:hypothetical protein